MELAIEQALQEAAPDLEGIDVEGVAAPPEPALGAFELPMVGGGAAGQRLDRRSTGFGALDARRA